MAPPSVSVVICAHTLDREQDLWAALASVEAQSRQADELLVVVDYNDELLTRVNGLGAKAVANAGPKGLSGARNTGTELASGDVVAYLDDDAVADPDWLHNLVAPYSDDRVVAVGGWANPRWDTDQPDWFPPEFAWVIGCSHRGLPTERSEVRNVIGCNMSFRRRVVVEAGGFDPGLGRTAELPLGCEETELCIRIHQSNPAAMIMLEPQAVVSHRVPAARTRWRYFVSRCRAEGSSKAHLSSLVGADDGLSSERSYILTVLPRAGSAAFWRIWREPLPNVRRMLALGGGLAATTGGYIEHILRRHI